MAGDLGAWTKVRLRSGGRARSSASYNFTPESAAMAAKERGVSGAGCYKELEERICGHRSVALVMKESNGLIESLAK